jgi:hypothetical protein
MDGEWDISDPDWPAFTGTTHDGRAYTINCYHLVPHTVGTPGAPDCKIIMDWVTGNIEKVPMRDQFKSLKHYWGLENLATRVVFE